jgi:3-methyl-2-oxobutanoate hydroxymethyltransferase
LIEDALAVQEAGAFSLLVEAVPPEVGKIITEKLSIPVLSIGDGVHCDGQLLIVSDLLGLFQTITPKFVKKYANLSGIIRGAFENYIREVRTAKFPREEPIPCSPASSKDSPVESPIGNRDRMASFG